MKRIKKKSKRGKNTFIRVVTKAAPASVDPEKFTGFIVMFVGPKIVEEAHPDVLMAISAQKSSQVVCEVFEAKQKFDEFEEAMNFCRTQMREDARKIHRLVLDKLQGETSAFATDVDKYGFTHEHRGEKS